MQRLKTRSQFQAALAGFTVARTPHFALHRPGSDMSTLHLCPGPDVGMGALVPKRWARRAVTRSLIKRQIYSVSKDFESALPAVAHVVRLRAAFDRQQFVSAKSEALGSAVRQELQQLFAQVAGPTALVWPGAAA